MSGAAAAPPARPDAARLRLANLLLWLTIAWNVGEGAVATTAGAMAGSVALVGFGLDSFIEVVAAAVLIWRLEAHDLRSGWREMMAHRIVGATFLALGAYIVAEAAYVVASGGEPSVSGAGLVLAVFSTLVMPALGFAKRRNAERLGSAALIEESKETLLCAYLSVTLFLGLAVNAVAGWPLADVLAALAMLPWILKEGWEGIRGEL